MPFLPPNQQRQSTEDTSVQLMPFLPPNQQRQSTEDTSVQLISDDKN